MKLVDKFWPFLKADYKSAEQYLEKQSKKGLHIRYINPYGITATYEKGEPKDIRYCIDYYTGTEEDAGTYQTMLKDAGWNFVGHWDGYLFFASNEKERPPRIYTEQKEEMSRLRRGLWLFDLPVGILSLILAYFTFTSFPETMTFKQFSYLLIILSMVGFGFVGLYRSMMLYYKSIVAAKKGSVVSFSSYKTAKFWGTLRGYFGIGMGMGVLFRMFVLVQHTASESGTISAICLSIAFLSVTVSLLSTNYVLNHCDEKTEKFIFNGLKLLMFGGVIGYLFF